MKETPGYPENRLDIRVDEQGKITYEQNPVFAQYYAPTREEKEEELEARRTVLNCLIWTNRTMFTVKNMMTGKIFAAVSRKR